MSLAGRTFFAGETPIRLGRRIGRGGEGEVFAVARDPAAAAKLYAPEAAQARAAKIAAMLRLDLAARAPLVAFPTAALADAEGRFAGFLMPRVHGAEPLHELYAPGARKRAFPDADYRFLTRAALNVARSVAAAHAAGCVIGDVNHSGFLIGQDALVALIDADSFQIEEDGTLHPCRVGVPEYTPPELHGAALADIARTPDNDAFGLAVVLFQLLFLGRHPFAGVGRGDPIPVAEAIERHAFAWGEGGILRPPPGALRLDEIDPMLAALFARAFAPDAAGRRPAAAEWVAALERAEAALVGCGAIARHHRPAHLGACPLCRIERETGAELFPAPGVIELRAALARREVQRRLAAAALPESLAYAPPEPLPSSFPPPRTPRQKMWSGLGVAGLAFMMVCAIGLTAVSPQSFLMCAPILIYGIGPVGDALMPLRGARRALAKIDRRLADVLAMTQAKIDLDAAWLLRADVAARAAGYARARRPTPRERAEASRLAADLERLEGMAAKIANAAAARHDEIDRLLASRTLLAAEMARLGEPAPPPPALEPRTLREATRRRLAQIEAQAGEAARAA